MRADPAAHPLHEADAMQSSWLGFRLSGIRGHVLAVVATLAFAAPMSLLADPPVGLLILPIIVAAYVGRLGAGLFATACATLAGILLADVARGATLALVGAVVSGVIEALHRSQAREMLARISTAEASQRAAQIDIAARTHEQRLREVTEVMSEVVWLLDVRSHRMLYASAAYERMWGRSVEALYRDPLDWMTAVHPDDRQRIEALAATIDCLTERHEAQYRIVRPDRSERVVRIAVFPVGDARVGGLIQDITPQVQLEEQLRQAAKLESIGLLAGGVAHDFNNVLAVISANAGLLADSIPPDSLDGELVTEINDAVMRATAMTRQLLAFSRKEVVEPVVLDVSTAIKDTRKMLRRMVGEDIVIETSFEPDLGNVRIDPGYLVQVLMNITVNARDAMPRGGTLSIATRNVGRHEVVIQITDTGCGMPPEVRARVFEPFFTTKGVGKGTGLGLSVVHGIVQQAGGRIEIDSTIGVGTTLRIYLPRVDARPDRIASIDIAGAQGSELILLVEDDVFIRRSTARSLQSRGYRVLEAADGAAALRLLETHELDLLLTDVVMPGMDGAELARIAVQRRPHLKVLYMSGYTDDTVLRHGVSTSTMSLIEKPFKSHELAGRVRQILDAAPRSERRTAASAAG